MLAGAELVANSLQHGAGQVEVAAWNDGGQFVIEVGDEGRLDDALHERLPAFSYEVLRHEATERPASPTRCTLVMSTNVVM